MDIKKVNVTPAMAEDWLTSVNASNRKLSPKTYLKYADDMRSGNWHDTHQNSIAFYDDGDLADGQHRLMAVVCADTTVSMFVAKGLSRDAASAIDQGRSRTVADGLVLGGKLASSKYVSQKVSVVKLIREIETGSQTPPTISEVAELIAALSGSIDLVLNATGSAPRGIGAAAVRAALVTAANNIPGEVVSKIARVLVSGMPDDQSDVTIIRLRNWLIQNLHNGQSEREAKYKTCLRVIHAYANGENLGVIRRCDSIYYMSGVFDGD